MFSVTKHTVLHTQNVSSLFKKNIAKANMYPKTELDQAGWNISNTCNTFVGIIVGDILIAWIGVVFNSDSVSILDQIF